MRFRRTTQPIPVIRQHPKEPVLRRLPEWLSSRNGSLFHSLGGPGSHARKGLRLLLDSEEQMISGAHRIVYSKNAEADRAFFRDVYRFKSVDAGHGWLIFALPPGRSRSPPRPMRVVPTNFISCVTI